MLYSSLLLAYSALKVCETFSFPLLPTIVPHLLDKVNLFLFVFSIYAFCQKSYSSLRSQPNCHFLRNSYSFPGLLLFLLSILHCIWLLALLDSQFCHGPDTISLSIMGSLALTRVYHFVRFQYVSFSDRMMNASLVGNK